MKTNLPIALFLLVLVVTACSSFSGGSGSSGAGGSNANTSTADTGIPECDKLIAKFEEKASDKNKESSMIERAAYSFVKDQIIKPIRDEIANKSSKDKKDIAAKCTEAYDKLIAEEEKEANKK